jgi:glutamate racemase
VGKYTQTKHVGVLGTSGTVMSDSYKIEIQKLHPDIQVFQEACSIWVPMVEYDEIDSPASDYFIKKHIDALFAKSNKIDTVILGCTHYPLLLHKIKKFVPAGVKIIVQGEIVADSLADYLNRHPEIESKISRGASIDFYTTDSTENFDEVGGRFWGGKIRSKHVSL